MDYTSAEPGMVFGQRFASITGTGSINGSVQAVLFGWVPVWIGICSSF